MRKCCMDTAETLRVDYEIRVKELESAMRKLVDSIRVEQTDVHLHADPAKKPLFLEAFEEIEELLGGK